MIVTGAVSMFAALYLLQPSSPSRTAKIIHERLKGVYPAPCPSSRKQSACEISWRDRRVAMTETMLTEILCTRGRQGARSEGGLLGGDGDGCGEEGGEEVDG